MDKRISGELSKGECAVDRCQTSVEGGREIYAPTKQRDNVANRIANSVRATVEAKAATEDDWRGGARGRGEDSDEESLAWQRGVDEMAAAHSERRPERPVMAVLGPAGSGETTAVERAVKERVAHGARVPIVAPAGRLAATCRA
eukprot:7570662-Pyramimonas_sp.AAC.1